MSENVAKENEATKLIARMPKTEVHLHLEGTIGPEALWKMAQRNNVPLAVGSLKALRQLYVFENFSHFVDLWLMMCTCLRSDRTRAEWHYVAGALADQLERSAVWPRRDRTAPPLDP